MDVAERAKDLGFVASGVSPCESPLFLDALSQWIDAGKFGQMGWFQRHRDLREDPSKLLPNCQTIISLAYPYGERKPCTPEGFAVARYSEPLKKDYHHRLRKKARALALEVEASHPGAKTRVCVDSAPILERSFAYRAGMGLFGKNNMLIVPGYGSYVFLAEILTTAHFPFESTNPVAKDLCGDCTRCLDACPTGALEGPWRFNAAKCLSYLTIEHEGDLDSGTGKRMGPCFLGCDICQEACPFNGAKTEKEVSLPAVTDFLRMDIMEFRTRFGKTALARPGLQRIKRNIIAIIKGSEP